MTRSRKANSSPVSGFGIPEPPRTPAPGVALVQAPADRQPPAGRSSDIRSRPLDPFIGSSAAIRDLSRRASRVAATGHDVLILGEPGVGKRTLARWLHANGPRRGHPLVEVPCPSLTEEQLDATLFGQAEGAFAGARGRQGLAELAEGGALLLVSVETLTLALQTKLIHVLEAGVFRRRGELRSRRLDVQVLATAGPDLPGRARDGRFRGAFYFRLAALTLELPLCASGRRTSPRWRRRFRALAVAVQGRGSNRVGWRTC